MVWHGNGLDGGMDGSRHLGLREPDKVWLAYRPRAVLTGVARLITMICFFSRDGVAPTHLMHIIIDSKERQAPTVTLLCRWRVSQGREPGQVFHLNAYQCPTPNTNQGRALMLAR